MKIDTLEMADISKTRTVDLCDESDECTHGQKVALAWIADMLNDGWEIWHPDNPTYWRMRLAAKTPEQDSYTTGVIGWGFDGSKWLLGWQRDTVFCGLMRMACCDYYFSEEELNAMLEALEYGNTVPIRKWMRKI